MKCFHLNPLLYLFSCVDYVRISCDQSFGSVEACGNRSENTNDLLCTGIRSFIIIANLYRINDIQVRVRVRVRVSRLVKACRF